MDALAGETISPFALFGAKFAGAVAGSVISIAYILPDGRREAAARFLAGAVTGLVFGGPAGIALADQLGFRTALSPTELAMMGSAAASLCAWWALGVLQRFAEGLFTVRRRDERDKEADQ